MASQTSPWLLSLCAQRLSLVVRTVRSISSSRSSSTTASAEAAESVPTAWNVDEIGARLGALPRRDLTAKFSGRAGILVPLVVHNGEPHVLFTLRSSQLRSHSGQVRFAQRCFRKCTSLLHVWALSFRVTERVATQFPRRSHGSPRRDNRGNCTSGIPRRVGT